MTSPALFSHRELLELAALDAFGLLDEYESELYNRSFHHAPAPVQDQIKRLQAELASDESLLPAEEPDRALRQKILEAVARTVETESLHLQPLARIGRHRRAADAGSGRLRRGSSAQFWRAASFVLAGVTVVMGYFLTEGFRESTKLAEATVLNDGLAVQSELLRTKTLDFLFDESQWVGLTAKESSQPYEAVLLVNHRTGEAAILMHHLPRADYILQVVHETTGETQRLQRFFSPGDFGSVKVTNIAPKVLASVAYWQITDLQGTVLLTSGAMS